MNPLIFVYLFAVLLTIGGVITPEAPLAGISMVIVGLIGLIFSGRAYIKTKDEKTPAK